MDDLSPTCTRKKHDQHSNIKLTRDLHFTQHGGLK